jgi:AraC-like DNA-binding protein
MATIHGKTGFPNNHVDIFFNLGDSNKGKLQQQPASFDFRDCIVSGLRTSFLEIRPSIYFEVVGIRFTLFGFYDLFRIPASELADQNVTQFDVLGKEAEYLYYRLMECGSVNSKFSLLEKWIQLKTRDRVLDIKSWSRVEQVLRNPIDSVQSTLAQLMGYSHKHIIALFRERAGLTPKAIQKIYRVNRVIRNLARPDSPDWSGLTYELGYSDQSHMIREVRQFTGFTPLQLQQQRAVIPNVFIFAFKKQNYGLSIRHRHSHDYRLFGLRYVLDCGI